ncbi:hypothetical protein [Marivirga sp.]|uniref:hypothetical protein n=1 Tax=Marivirga sp. TaxID=2018662 RepID=UPI003DA76D63
MEALIPNHPLYSLFELTEKTKYYDKYKLDNIMITVSKRNIYSQLSVVDVEERNSSLAATSSKLICFPFQNEKEMIAILNRLSSVRAVLSQYTSLQPIEEILKEPLFEKVAD